MLAAAEPDRVEMSPYTVSFDLGMPKSAYYLEISDPVKSETLSGYPTTEYEFGISDKQSDSYAALITIYTDPRSLNKTDPSDTIRGILESKANELGGKHIHSDIRTIDGHNGGIIDYVLDDRELYEAVYVLSTDPYTVVDIMSLYPWDEGTLSLLKTIHVEGPGYYPFCTN